MKQQKASVTELLCQGAKNYIELFAEAITQYYYLKNALEKKGL
jgi:hypothetical protein